MVINLNEPISSDTLDKILSSFNSMALDDKLDIYLSTPGGDGGVMEAIVHFINRNTDKINLYGYEDLSSAGFYIFFGAECYRELLPGTTGMVHLVAVTTKLTGDPTNWRTKEDSKLWYNWTKLDKKRRLLFLKSVGLTEEEVTKIEKGGDLYLLPKRMEELLKNQQG